MHLFQHFEAALRLFGFACLIAETVNKRLQVAALLLLLFRLLLQLFFPQGTGILKSIVIAGISDQFQIVKMNDIIAKRVENIPVMADDDQSTAIFLQMVFQPHSGFQIEVIGRFVEQQDFGRLKQGRSQSQTHAPTAGELPYRA